MNSISLTPQAVQDLDDIWDYIAEDSPDRATAFLQSIEEKILNLAETPHIGRARPELLSLLRSFPIGKYVIFYQPIDNGIEVVRVLHGSRDINDILFD